MPAQQSPRFRRRWQSAGGLIGALATRVAPAVVFVSFGVAKFTSHASEANSFRAYGLPHPGAFAYAIGIVEIVGGLALLWRLAAPAAALVLAADMLGAIVVSGIGRGETVSLTLAPLLLVAMTVVLARTGSALWRRRGER